MIIFENMIKHFKAIDLNTIVLNVVSENENVIIDLNAEVQLFEEGITSKGVSIASFAPYSPVTVQIKMAKGQPTNRVTLRDEGDFQSSFFVYIGADYFQIMASDWKTEKLTFEYGDDIMGLTSENLKYFLSEYVIPEILKNLKYDRKN